MTESAVRIALVYPELLGTYGDGGNAEVLAARLRWRGLAGEIVSVPAGDPLPQGCDVYLLGGGEDEPQVLAGEGIAVGGTLLRSVEAGAVVLAVCAGLQIAGESFPGADGAMHDGLGLLPVETRRSLTADAALPPRAVGDVLAVPHASLGHLGPLIGYENHGGRTRPAAGAAGHPLGTVVTGTGNGTTDRAEGWVATRGAGSVVATYLHGPVLAQNPALADHLLSLVTGRELPPLDRADPAEALRQARLRALGPQHGQASGSEAVSSQRYDG